VAIVCRCVAKAQQAIIELMRFPDLDKLSSSDLETFLDATELSAAQRQVDTLWPITEPWSATRGTVACRRALR
jgi:hypothetical protein